MSLTKSNVFNLEKWLDPRSYFVDGIEDAKNILDMNIAHYQSKKDEWNKNVERNMNIVKATNGKFIQSIYGSMNGGVVLVVGAGKSTEKNLNEIRKLKNRAVVICVDRAYKILRDAFIMPHLVVCADSQQHVSQFVRRINKRTSVALSVFCHNDTYRAVKENDLYWHGPINPFDPFTSEWIEKYGARIASCRQGFTVTSIAIDIAIWLGSNVVITVGNDLGWKSRREYKKDINSKNEMVRINDHFVSIPAFVDASVYQFSFPRWHPDMVFVDASDGLRSGGWLVKSLKEINQEMEGEQNEKVS